MLEKVEPLLFLPITIGGGLAVLWRGSRKGLLGWAGALLAISITARGRALSLSWDAGRIPHEQAPWGWALLAGALTLGFVIVLQLRPQAKPVARWSELVVGAFVCAIMATSGHMFLDLAKNTEAAIAGGRKLEGRNVKTTNVLWDELRGNYNDYLTIPGFEVEKEAINSYMTRHRDEWRHVWMPVPEYKKRQKEKRRERWRQRQRQDRDLVADEADALPGPQQAHRGPPGVRPT